MLYACGGPLGAAEQATAPYRALCESLGLTFEGDAAARPRELAFSTRSELPDVTPADIRITLRAGDEAIAIPVGADGRFMLPLDRKWFDADAVLVSNQPKGTWVLSCDVKQNLTAEEIAFTAVSPHVKDGRIPYVALVRLAHDSRRRLLEQVLEKQVGRDVAQRMTATGILDELEKADSDMVILLRATQDAETAEVAIVKPTSPVRRFADRWAAAIEKDKDEVVRRVAPGTFVIERSQEVTEQNPVLTLSDNPSWQCMLIDRHADDVGSPESSGTAPTIANP